MAAGMTRQLAGAAWAAVVAAALKLEAGLSAAAEVMTVESLVEARAVAAAASSEEAGEGVMEAATAAGQEVAAAGGPGAAGVAAEEEAMGAVLAVGWEMGSEEGSAAAVQGGRPPLRYRCRTAWSPGRSCQVCRWGLMA